MRNLTRDGQPLTVHDTGGGGHAILMLHGLAGYAGEWSFLAESLRSRYRVITVDQRGQLPGDMSRQAYVDDAIFVIEQLGLQQPILCGQSLGGHTAMLAAAFRPDLVSSLVLIEAGPGGAKNPELPQQIGRWIDSFPVPFKSFDDAVEFFTEDFGSRAVGTGWAQGLQEREGGWWPRFDRDAMVESISGLGPCWTEWESIICPVLVIRAANGSMSEEEVTGMAPRAQIVTIPDAGHDVHLDQPTAVLTAIRAHLQR